MLTIKNLSKHYSSGILTKSGEKKKKLILEDINLHISPGEKVAIIGRNGAGKTTLLRLISGSLQQSTGDIDINGTIYPLMNIGLGINEKLTGRENIFSSLVYNGFVLSSSELKKIETDIEEFTELGELLDTPFYTYSLGMKMRLMFAVATSVRPEIFLIDEVLGAGDPYFLLKCQERLRNIIEQNQSTLLIVSHSTQLLRKFCDRGIWIKNGKIFLDGNINDVCVAYDAYIERISVDSLVKDIESEDNLMASLDNGHKFYIWQDKSDLNITSFEIKKSNETIKIYISLVSKVLIKYNLRILITLWARNGDRIGRLENDIDSIDFSNTYHHKLEVSLQESTLPFGIFDVTISIFQDLKNPFLHGLKQIYVGSNMASISSQNDHMLNANSIPHKWL